MNHRRSELYVSAVGAGVLFLILLTLALASTTWAAPGAQGTIGKPTVTPTATSEGGCSDCVQVTSTPTPLPKLPTTGGDTDNGIALFGIPLLVVLGAATAWKGLQLVRR